jgi:hypothetical protein
MHLRRPLAGRRGGGLRGRDAPEAAAERLLVVDDDLAMRRLLEVTLAHVGDDVAARA